MGNINLIVVKDYDEMSSVAFNYFKTEIEKGSKNFGMATGSTPIGLYKLICEDYENHDVYANLSYYNLDEYHGLSKNHSQSYYSFMNKMLFSKIKAKNCYIPNGEIDISDSIDEYQNILDSVEIDVQLLGLGVNAHIGFNEPGTPFDLKTNFVKLKNTTREANKRFFNNDIDEVPKYALTMGIDDIMKAKKILVLANGESKATAVYNMLYGEIDELVPASILQSHADVTLIVDTKAASKLPLTSMAIDISSTRIKVGIFNKNLERIAFEVVSHQAENIYEKTLKIVNSMLDNNVYKIGVSISGYVNNGVVSHPRNKMFSFEIKSQLEKDLRKKVYVINRANASAYGEYIVNYNTAQSLYYISLATGIGGGYVYDGELITSKRGLVGEISNMIIDTHEFNNDFFADGSIEMHYNTYKLTKNEKLFIKQIGIVVANIVNTIDPEVIVFDLKNLDLNENLIEKIEYYTNDLLYDVHGCNIEIFKSQLKDESLVGAALFAMKGC
ncbi:MAG: ROK family protein [Bacilli bacterium]